MAKPPNIPAAKQISPPYHEDRLRAVALLFIKFSHDATARQQFSVALDCINNWTKPMPQVRKDGKADRPHRVAVSHAALIHAIQLVRESNRPDLTENAVRGAEAAAGATQENSRIVGDIGTGFALEVVG